jgi:hypothetical protein
MQIVDFTSRIPEKEATASQAGRERQRKFGCDASRLTAQYPCFPIRSRIEWDTVASGSAGLDSVGNRRLAFAVVKWVTVARGKRSMLLNSVFFHLERKEPPK